MYIKVTAEVVAHHSRGAKAERRSSVEVEVITVLVTQKMIVAGLSRYETQLAVEQSLQAG